MPDNYIVEILLTRCSGCGENKPASAFYKSHTTVGGLQTKCKACSKTYNGKYNKNPKRAELRAQRKSQAYDNPTPKLCKRCGKDKPRTDFHICSYSADALATCCKACTVDYSLAYHHLPVNKERTRVNDANRHASFREYLNDLKARPCQRCGGEFPPCVMDWHHRDPTTKKYTVAAMNRLRQSQVIAEIAKCDLVCANCHRIIEWEDRQSV